MTSVRPWLLGMLSAIFLPLGFVGFDYWPFAPVAYIPLIIALDGVRPGRAALLGFLCGFLANLIGHLWLPRTIHVFGGLSWAVAWLLACLLFAYQGIVFALVGAIYARLHRAGRCGIWAAPLAVVSVETVFPLVLPIFMGCSFHRFTILIQAVDLFGPQLLTAVLVLCNLSILGIGRAVFKRRSPSWTQVLAGPVAVAALVAYGVLRVPAVERLIQDGETLTIGAVQPDLGMFEKWHDPGESLRRHTEASRRLAAEGVDLVLWPEAAYVFAPIDRAATRLPDELSQRFRAPFIFGAVTQEASNSRPTYHNSAILADSSGRVAGIYDKVHLLAFSETLPGGNLVPWLYELTPIKLYLRPGSGPGFLPFEHHGISYRIAPLICFEDILPGYVRKMMTLTEAHLLVNLTNDAWFGDSPAARIHFTLSKFRAIEHRRYLVRVTNNGVTAVVDPCGRVVAQLPVSERSELVEKVRLLEETTVYGRVGNIFGYGCVLAVVWLLWRSRRTKQSPLWR